jgi:hypothetical protein
MELPAHCVAFCVWLISLGRIFSRSTHIVVCASAPFPFQGQTVFQGADESICFRTYLLMGCFYFLATMNNTAVNTHVHVLVCFVETRSRYVAQAGLELMVFLSLPPECWDYRGAPPFLATYNEYTSST